MKDNSMRGINYLFTKEEIARLIKRKNNSGKKTASKKVIILPTGTFM